MFLLFKFILLSYHVFSTISRLKQTSFIANKKPKTNPFSKELIFNTIFSTTVINITKIKPKKLKILLVLLVNLFKSFRISLNTLHILLFNIFNKKLQIKCDNDTPIIVNTTPSIRFFSPFYNVYSPLYNN